MFHGPREDVVVKTNAPNATVKVVSGEIPLEVKAGDLFSIHKLKSSDKRRLTAEDLQHINPEHQKNQSRAVLEATERKLAKGKKPPKYWLITYEVSADGYLSNHYTDMRSSHTGAILLNIFNGFSLGFLIDAITGSYMKFQSEIYVELEKGESPESDQESQSIDILKKLSDNGKLDSATQAKVKALIAADSLSNEALEISTNYAISYDNQRETEKDKLDSIYNFSVDQTTLTDNLTASSGNSRAYREDSDVAKLRKIKQEFPDLKYRRSSIYSLMINDHGELHNNAIVNAFGNFELSDKYNNHNVGPYLVEVSPGTETVQNIDEFLKEEQIAKKMVAKWFNRSVKGGFNVERVAEAGQYNATELDVAFAEKTKRGTALLEDAGEELIKNTFLIVNDYQYISKKEALAKASQTASYAKLGASFIPGAGAVVDATDNIETVAGAGSLIANGYVVRTTSYLYQLNWDEGIANTFYAKHWTTDNSLDQDKVDAFLKSDLFSLKLIGSQSAFADLMATSFSSKSDDEIIADATIKATDAAYAKLQKNYEEFKTKTPLYSVDPLAAKIGLKEGLTKKSKFEVLEQIIDENGKTTYKRRKVIKVDKNHIWDNRYNAVEDPNNENAKFESTYFKGSSNGLYPGMLIREIK